MATALAVSALLTGCAGNSLRLAANPSPSQLATPEAARRVTAVTIPTGCERLAGTVPPPAWRDGDDARLVLRRYEAALDQANQRLGAARACVQRIVAAYRAGT